MNIALIVWVLIYASLGAMLIIVTLNSLSYPRLTPARQSFQKKVSILIPARDEEAQIGETIANLLAQDYPHFELVVLDDHSSDGTVQRALEAAKGDPRFRLLKGKSLPAGWLGKTWACHQLAQQAQGEILIFTDADVTWERASLGAALQMTMDYRADMLTIFPTQLTVSWAERLIVPLMNFAILAYLLEWLVRKLPAISLAAANGQVLLFRKEIYHELGGHKRVRAEIIEDVKLARQVKGLGYRLVIGLGHGMIKARMYTGWKSVREGFGKNILAGYGNQPILLLLSTLFHLLIFVYPWLALIGAMIPEPDLDMLVRAGVAVAMGIGVRAIAAITSRAILIDALWMPASVISMTLIALQGLRWHFSRSGPHWKGRNLRHVDNPSGGLE